MAKAIVKVETVETPPVEESAPVEEPAKEEVRAHPLDTMFQAEEAEIQKFIEHPTEDTGEAKEVLPTEEKPPVEEPPKEEPPKEVQPAEEEPAKEAKAAEEKPPPVENKQEKPRPKTNIYKQMREMKRERDEEKRKREELEQRLARRDTGEGDVDDLEIDDPLVKVGKKVEDIEQQGIQTQEEMTRLRAMEQQRIEIEEIKNQEDLYSKDHPDYHDAVQNLAEKRLGHYERTGRIDHAANWELQNRPDVVARFAEQTGRDPDSDESLIEAAKDMCGRILINNDRMEIIRDCRATGRNIPEVVYGLAQDFGWNGQPKGEEAPKAPPEEAAKERVKRVKEQESVTQSLSAMQPGSGPKERKITSRQQLLDLDPAEADQYVREMDKKDPFWDRNLT